MFTRLPISVNCHHNWLTSPYGPPNRKASISDDTFATTGNVASRAPDSSTIKSSAKWYSRSRTTRGPRRMCSFRRSSSLSLRGFPSKSKTRHPGVSSLNRWSRAKMLHPLIVSQDLMRAMRQHRDIFSTDPTIEVTRFASCISSPSHEELTYFVRLPHLPHFECALWSHTTTGVICLWVFGTRITRVNNTWTRTCSTLPKMLKYSI